MVDQRQGSILRAVVEHYVATSQPVSSSQVTHDTRISASPATVRSEMATLERDGYLQQPHTSAGRIPTDRGYRFFVDQLTSPGTLAPAQSQDVRSFFNAATGEIEKMLHETGRLLSGLTGAAAVVVGPDHDTTRVRSVQLVTLGPHTALAVLVFSDGGIEKRSIPLDDGTDEATVTAAAARLDAHLDGKALSYTEPVLSSGEARVDVLVDRTLHALQTGHHDESDNVFVGGASRLASSFDAVEKVRNALTILEQQYVVVSLISDLLDRGMSVSIGAENNLESLADCSLVVAPTFIEGEQRGSVAILGPTRMDYGQAMAAVTIVSRRLGERLSEAAR